MGQQIQDQLNELKTLNTTLAQKNESLTTTEKELRDSEARFRGLIEGSIQGILIHRNFIPLFANDAYARIFGFARTDDLLKLTSLEVLMPLD
ncbi:MAG: PAS domain S-box protein, partial [Bacteroidota bacterium]